MLVSLAGPRTFRRLRVAVSNAPRQRSLVSETAGNRNQSSALAFLASSKHVLRAADLPAQPHWFLARVLSATAEREDRPDAVVHLILAPEKQIGRSLPGDNSLICSEPSQLL